MIIIKGKARAPLYIYIKNDKVEFREAFHRLIDYYPTRRYGTACVVDIHNKAGLLETMPEGLAKGKTVYLDEMLDE